MTISRVAAAQLNTLRVLPLRSRDLNVQPMFLALSDFRRKTRMQVGRRERNRMDQIKIMIESNCNIVFEPLDT